MMQSILSTTPNKPLSTEINGEVKSIDAELNVDQKGEEEKTSASSSFSSLLENMIEGEQGSVELDLLDEPVAEAESIELGLSDEENQVSEVSDSDLALNPVKLATEELNQVKLGYEAPKPVSAVTDFVDKKVSLEGIVQDEPRLKESMDAPVETEKKTLELQSDNTHLVSSETVISPILAKIEEAQKTDTKVTEAKAPIGTVDLGALPKEGEKSSTSSVEKSDKLNVAALLSNDSELDDDPQLKENLRHTDKLDNIIASLKTEVDKPTFSHDQEGSVLRPITTMSAVTDKLLSQIATNNPSSMQSTALQQPLELQGKHASAMMGERILMMLKQGKQEVTIRLDPAELGSMHIKLHIQQDQLQMTIQTQVGQSRDIIEQNLPRLREQLAQQGINLAEANVEHQSKQDQSNAQQSPTGNLTSHTENKVDESILDDQGEWISTKIQLPAQGIDYYA
ncbi:flagellar hook-length control protein FliK [Psychromonas hadalis]|uniref:flagellar hook-length control protein FliK n=1 Tax=Psychromonas hadalis TaxID=211669 RepID=UPI0003B4D55D|nr:flagellar hook-length control protein FliK [Psychromonas hadalis]